MKTIKPKVQGLKSKVQSLHLARYHARAVENRLAGLTAHGRSRRRIFVAANDLVAHRRAKYHRLAALRTARGLTRHGTPFLPGHLRRLNSPSAAWNRFKSGQDFTLKAA